MSHYGSYFRKPIEKLRVTEQQRATLRDMYQFSLNPDVAEVVFSCVPHCGSELATNWVGKIGRMVARLPLTILHASVDILTLNADALANGVGVTPATSIDSLSPNGSSRKPFNSSQ